MFSFHWDTSPSYTRPPTFKPSRLHIRRDGPNHEWPICFLTWWSQMGSLQPARCSQACRILFLLCFFPVTVQHLTSSQWPHLPSVGREKKKTSEAESLSVYLWWSSLKPPGSNLKSEKHRCPKAKMGMNKCGNSHSSLGSLILKYGWCKPQQDWESVTQFIDTKDASSMRQLRALEVFVPD